MIRIKLDSPSYWTCARAKGHITRVLAALPSPSCFLRWQMDGRSLQPHRVREYKAHAPLAWRPTAQRCCNRSNIVLPTGLFCTEIGRGRADAVTGMAPDKLTWEFGLRRSWAATAMP